MARVRVKVPIEPETPTTQPSETDATKQRQFDSQWLNRSNLVIGLLVVVVGVALVILLNDRNHLEQQVNKLSSGQSTSGQTQNQQYINAVSSLAQVPSGVTPEVKTPTADEITQLAKNNILYKDAKAGDVFLLYTNPDKSLFLVIYRPSTHKIMLATIASAQTTTK